MAMPVELTSDFLLAVLEAAPDGMLVVDASGTIRHANHTAETLCGYQRHGLIGHAVEMLVPPSASAGHIGLRSAFLATPASRPMGSSSELSMRRADGSEIPVEIGLAPLSLDGATFVAVSIRDVTDRRAADRERRRLLSQVAVSEQYFRSAFEGAPVGMVVTEMRAGGARIVRRVNEQFAAILDTDAESLIGTDLAARSHPDELAADADAIALMVQGRQVAVRRDRRYRRSDGSFVWTNEQTVRMRDDGEPALTLSHVVDISAQRAKQESESRARRLESQIGQLVAELLQRGITDTTYDDIARVAAQLIDADDAAMILHEPGAAVDYLAGWFGRTASESAAGGLTPPAELVAQVRAAGRVVRLQPDELLPDTMRGRFQELIGAPLRLGDQASGIIVASSMVGGSGFTADCAQTLDTFCTRMALALAAAQGRVAETKVRLLDDRERIARDLHDTVIQDLFAAGMRISAALPRVTDHVAAERLNEVVDQIDATIKRVRAVVFDLHHQQAGRSTLSQLIVECVNEASRALGFAPTVELVGDVDDVPSRFHDHVLGVLREGLSNVARHAHASAVDVSVRVADGRLAIGIDDNGCGVADGIAIGSGTRNLAARAAMFGGHAEVRSQVSTAGASLRWMVPING